MTAQRTWCINEPGIVGFGMALEKAHNMLKLWAAFPPGPPNEITQEPFDAGITHLRKLAQLRPRERAEAADLWEYTQDLLYSDGIDRSLLAYLLPFCLEAWRDDLRG